MFTRRVAPIAAAFMTFASPHAVFAAPSIAGGFTKPGLSQAGSPGACVSMAGAATRASIGPTTLVQVMQCKAAIFNRVTGAFVSFGGLNVLANAAAGSFNLDPQVIWDPTTQRFYYAIASLQTSATGTTSVISYGFSKTASPANLTTMTQPANQIDSRAIGYVTANAGASIAIYAGALARWVSTDI